MGYGHWVKFCSYCQHGISVSSQWDELGSSSKEETDVSFKFALSQGYAKPDTIPVRGNMAPSFIIFMCICFLCVHISVVHSQNLPCTTKDCRKTSCPPICSCLGFLVDCSTRKLLDIPKDLPNWVEILDLQNNAITSLSSEALGSLRNLTKLDLQNNAISSLSSEALGSLKNLTKLSLSHNKIVKLDRDTFVNLTALETLKLNKNKVSSIPKELFKHLGNLRHLEMNSNSLTQIEGLSFQGLSSLSVLKLRHSGISHLLDGAFYGLNSIRTLKLDYNNITKITKGWLYGLNSLQRLYLNNNNISEIEDDAWDSGKRILELDMTHNNLQIIAAKTFDKLYSVKRLILSHNQIMYIEENAFRSLSALQYLEMASNKLQWTIEDTGNVFVGLDRLKFLDLSRNKIKTITRGSFSGLSRLEMLNLTENDLATIEENAFGKLSHLQELLINTSSLICDCELMWLLQDFDYPIAANCGFPKTLAGSSVFQVPSKDFVCGSPKPAMTKEPLTKITLKGENVTLECQAKSTGLSDVKYLWRKDGKLLHGTWLWHKSENTRIGNHTFHTSWLTIQNIQDKDEGYYQCVISNQFGSVYSNKARITVHVFPVFTKTPVDVAIKSGSTARLECGAEGQPQPDITWRKDGGEDFPAARERRMHVMLPTDDLFFIVGVKASDTGVYSCSAKNVAGVITANATLTVLETPSFLKKMDDKEILSGEAAVLECMSAGSPKPNQTWFKDDVPLLPSERQFFTANNQLLIIIHSKVSDSGSYTCRISNILGSDQGTSRLNVLPASQSGGSFISGNNMTGIVVIAVVVCVVGTSIVWVIVIHHTRKTREDFNNGNASNESVRTEIPPFAPYRGVCHDEFEQSIPNIYLDTHSGHSKDSGTGDSAQPSSNDLLIEDDHQELLINMHSSPVPSTTRKVSGLSTRQDVAQCDEARSILYSSSSGSVCKERAPLLPPTFRTSHHLWKAYCKSMAEFQQQLSGTDSCSLSCSEGKCPGVPVQRSLSVDQLNRSSALLHHCSSSERPRKAVLPRVKSERMEQDSGFSTFSRSVTQPSVNNWSSESLRLPTDIPNDSGSFSIASEDMHFHINTHKYAPSVLSVSDPPTQTCSKPCGVAASEHRT